ncbi:YjbH domain-containing protein [Opacimonas viscosa]|uniref:YjbH domain-containing protein n=1 Tax=Opacimonas viscosa TaxID=2961944 RepID=A0AA41X2E0_9ALTE|nr:YjbH domain-containing protein [Opacimonas viscosa]MCP3429106.1 YjbH domain-containing protein [Opacimonas viscosa]
MRKKTLSISKNRVCFSVLFFLSSLSLGHSGLGHAQTVQATDGQFRLSISDTAVGKQTQVDYQAAPWLHLGFAYNQDAQSYQYNASTEIVKAQNSLPNLVVGVKDFLDTADERSQFMQAGYSLGHSAVQLGWATGASLDGWFAKASHHFIKERVTVFANTTSYSDTYQARYHAADWQVGASWQVTPNLAFSVTHSAEQNLGFGVSITLDSKKRLNTQLHPNALGFSSEGASSSSFIKLSSAQANEDKRLAIQSLLSYISVNTSVAQITDKRLQLVVQQNRYSHWPDAVASAHSVLSARYATEFDDIEYVIEHQGHLLHRFLKPIAKSHKVNQAANYTQLTSARPTQLQPVTNDTLSWVNKNSLTQGPQFTIHLDNRLWLPQTPSQIDNTALSNESDATTVAMDGTAAATNTKMAYQLFASAEMDWALTRNWSVQASYQVDLADNFSKDTAGAQLGADGLIPVNSQLQERFMASDHRLASASVKFTDSHVTQLYSDVAHLHYQAEVGYLDMNHVGFSGELLYQPWLSRIAVGASFSHTCLREIDSTFELSDIQSTAALISGYWSLPIYNLDAAVHAGRFLAEDTGIRLELRRTFANGWQFGIWATDTQKRINGTKQHFSDKGLFLRIPLGSVTGSRIKTRFTSQIGDLNRNNGAMLSAQKGTLWWQHRDVRPSLFQ